MLSSTARDDFGPVHAMQETFATFVQTGHCEKLAFLNGRSG
eukprot:COSAG06_NODE_16_length_34949_cov_31.500832_13_plen_41_part_00